MNICKFSSIRILAGILLCFCVSAIRSEAQPELILAKVGEINITHTEFQNRIKQLPAQYQGFYANGEGRKVFLQQLIDEKLIYLAAQKEQYSKRKEVQKELALAQQNITAGFYIRELFKKIKVTDADIQKNYEKNKEQYKQPAKIRARHILVDTEAEALDLKNKIETQAISFESAALEKSKDPSAKQNKGDLGFFGKGEMVPEFEKVAYELTPGKISAPVKTNFGWHIIELLETQPEKLLTLEEVKKDIQEAVYREKQKQLIDQISSEQKKKIKIEVNKTNLEKM